MEALDKEENDLAAKLKTELCYPNGREKYPVECANVFHQLGLIYQKKDKISHDKIYLIQSSALLNAAIVRNPDNKANIIEDLHKLCSYVLKQAKAKEAMTDLVDASKEIKELIAEMRETANKRLANLKIISTNAQGKGLHKMEECKIADVQNIQKTITQDYKNIMKHLANHCKRVMGEPPCEFALFGMGSLARSEITPYSDFENAIVLEEGVQYNDNYQDILNYFRWFAVIFQIVLINLGETIIPRVAIPSLNNPDNSEGDWFYAIPTTCGIAFDGLMPTACKTPLGRLYETKLKPWTTELIKPISQMLIYLDNEEAAKNGYHLAQILSNVCFVSGNKNVYEIFEKSIQERLRSDDVKTKAHQELLAQMKENLENFGIKEKFCYLNSGEGFNVKSLGYRSTTIFISALGRMHNITKSSSIRVISKLVECGTIDKEFAHKLQYAVAIACEIRLKLYMKKENQDDWIDDEIYSKTEIGKLTELIGEKSLMDYMLIAYSLQQDLGFYYQLSSKYFYNNPAVVHVSVCHYLGRYERAINSANLLLESNKQANTSQVQNKKKTCYITGTSYRHIEKHCKDLLKSQSTCVMPDDISEHFSKKDAADILKMVALSYWKLRKYEEALKQAKRELKLRTELTTEKNTDRNIGEVFNTIGNCMRSLQRHEEALQMHTQSQEIVQRCSYKRKERDEAVSYSCIARELISLKRHNEALKIQNIRLKILNKLKPLHSNTLHIAKCTLDISICLRYLKQGKEALDKQNKSLDMIKRLSTDESTYPNVANAFVTIGLCLNNMKKHKEAMNLYQTSLDIKKKISKDVDSDVKIATVIYNMGICLSYQGKYEENLECFEKELAIKKRVSSDESSDPNIADAFVNIGICLNNMKKHEEAMKHYQTSLDIRKNISKDVDSDVKIATVLYNMGICLRNQDKYEVSLECLEKELAIRKQVSSDENSDPSVADAIVNIGICLNNKKNHKEAMNHFQSSLDIRKEISKDVDSDVKIAAVLYNMGICLSNQGKYKESLECFEKELAIRKQVSSDESTDLDVAISLNKIGICLNNMKKHKEAMNHYQTSLDIRKEISKDVDSDVKIAAVIYNMGICLSYQGKYKESLECFEKELAIKKRVSSDESTDPNVADASVTIGICLNNMKKHEEAMNHYQTSLNIRKEISKDVDSDVKIAAVIYNMGICLSYQGKYEESLECFEKELAIRKRVSSDESTDLKVANSLNQRDKCLVEMKKP